MIYIYVVKSPPKKDGAANDSRNIKYYNAFQMTKSECVICFFFLAFFFSFLTFRAILDKARCPIYLPMFLPMYNGTGLSLNANKIIYSQHL